MASSKSKAEAGDWSVKLMAELKSLSLMMLFFAIWLVPLMVIKNLLLEQYNVPLSHLSTAIIGALILSKVVVVLEHVPLGSWITRRPIWVDLVLRTLLYAIGVAIILLLEKGIEGRHETGSFWPALLALIDHPDINHVWVNTIVVTGALFSYNLLAVLRRNLGDQFLLGLLSRPLPKN